MRPFLRLSPLLLALACDESGVFGSLEGDTDATSVDSDAGDSDGTDTDEPVDSEQPDDTEQPEGPVDEALADYVHTYGGNVTIDFWTYLGPVKVGEQRCKELFDIVVGNDGRLQFPGTIRCDGQLDDVRLVFDVDYVGDLVWDGTVDVKVEDRAYTLKVTVEASSPGPSTRDLRLAFKGGKKQNQEWYLDGTAGFFWP